MLVRPLLGTVLICSVAIVPIGAQGHGGSAATPHGNPHTGAAPQGTPHTAQGPKSPNPGAAHKNDGAGKTPKGAHGPMTAQERLATQPQLSQRLQTMLPAGMTVDQAAAGFKNLGQFVAAVHVSKNLGIPFDQLKAQLTGSSAKSLGAAIHTLKPDADAKGEAERAEAEAESIMGGAKK